MLRIAHGSTLGDEDEVLPHVPDAPPSINVSRFDYLFGDLATNPDALLPVSSSTLADLARLGDTMRDLGSGPKLDSNISSGYTYLGQFIDHDLVFSKVPRTPRDLTDSCMLGDSLLQPWSPDRVRKEVTNQRTRILELETIYGPDASPAPMQPDGKSMLLGRVFVENPGTMSEDDLVNDLPLLPGALFQGNRVPSIGDKRNDQTLMLSQLHVAFLRAHNAIVRRYPEFTFADARRLLTQHYHWLIINDLLKKNIAKEGIVEKVIANQHPLYNPGSEFYLPIEFTAAAYRFGHSMIRLTYYVSNDLPEANLRKLFTLAALSRPDGTSLTSVPKSKVINWVKFLRENNARQLDTRLVEPLLEVLDAKEQIVPCETRLAVQDLRRGYMFSIPTGQAIANELKINRLTEQDFQKVCSSDLQFQILQQGGFVERTPLWFYILAEAALSGGNRLGELGSYLVAEVLVGLVRRIPDSFLNNPAWKPTLGIVPGEFTLTDFFKLAGVFKE